MKKFNVGWGLTNVCNMNCRFCYSKGTRSSTKDKKLSDWIKFIDKNHEYIDSINYGTGENSTCDDFFTFIRYVRENYPDITQALTTNGYTYQKIKDNQKFYDDFLKSIDEVDVSLDFKDKDKHNAFRGQKNAYDWAINMLEFLQKHGKKSTIVFVGFNETLQEDNIDGLFEIAKKYNAILRMNIYRPVSKDFETNSEFILSYDVLVKALKYINEKYEIINLSDALLGNVFSFAGKVKDFSGTKSIRILPNGDISPSTYLIDEKYRGRYNISQDISLEDIKFEEFSNPIVPEECKNCRYEETCAGGVFDRRILWYGTLEKRDPYCPLNNGEKLPEEKFKISKTARISVHDDYLPTLFFKNKDQTLK